MVSKFELKQEYKRLVGLGKDKEAMNILRKVQSFASNPEQAQKVVVDPTKKKVNRKKK